MYHRINRSEPASGLSVPPEVFLRQLEWHERKSFRFLSLDEVVERQGKSPFWNRTVSLTFDDGFTDNYKNAFSILISKKKPAALFVVTDWVGQEGFLGWREIRELAEGGITIGSHSVTHRWLPDIQDESALRREIFESKKIIEDQIGKEVRHFSYPVGGVNSRVADLVQKAGYDSAWVAGARPLLQAGGFPMLLRRIKVTPKDGWMVRFAIKAYGLKRGFCR